VRSEGSCKSEERATEGGGGEGKTRGATGRTRRELKTSRERFKKRASFGSLHVLCDSTLQISGGRSVGVRTPVDKA